MKRTVRIILSFILVLALLSSAMLPMVSALDVSSEEYKFFSLLKNVDSDLTNAISAGTATGNWSSAKSELLRYYKNKFSSIDYITNNSGLSSTNKNIVYDTLCRDETVIDEKTVSSTSNQKITFNLSSSNVLSTYVLTTFVNSNDTGICIASKEAGASTAPTLSVTFSDGTSESIAASGDTYVRATGYGVTSGTAASYRRTNYGSSQQLWAMHQIDRTNQMPYSSNEMRTYLTFDLSSFVGKTVKSATMTVYAALKNPQGSSVSASSLPLMLMNAYYKTFTESTLTWSELENNNSVGYYSWNGFDGIIYSEELYGERYSNLHVTDEFANGTSNFADMTSLCVAGNYAEAKKRILRFAEQTYDIMKSGTGFPKARPLEPANRALEIPYIYKTFLENDVFSAEENYTFLRWFYQNILNIHNEISRKIFTSGSTPNTVTNEYISNWGVWHISGFYNCIGFFNEFSQCEEWTDMFEARLSVISEKLLNSDGSYIEVTLGYPTSVIKWYTGMLNYMAHQSYSTPVSDTLKTKIISLAKFLVDCTYPDGVLPEYGDGAGGNVINAVNNLLSVSGIQDNSTKMQNILWYKTEGEQGLEPARSILYKDSKIAVDRSGWKSTDSMMFVNAKGGGQHAHYDALAVLLYSNERNLLIDPGTITYDHASDAFSARYTAAHNTVEVDNRTQNFSGTTIQTGYDGSADNINLYANDSASTTRAYTTASSNVTHYRNITFVKALDNLMLVNDLLVPSDNSSHTYNQNWHVLNNANVTVSDTVGSRSGCKWGYTNFASGGNLMISQASTNSSASPITSSAPYGYDAHSSSGKSKYMQFTQTASGTVSYNTALYPYDGQNGGIEASKNNIGLSDANASLMRINKYNNSSLSGSADEIVYYNSFEEAPVERTMLRCGLTGRSQYLTTDALNALYFVPNNESSVPFMYISNGQSLEIENRYDNGTNDIIASVYASTKVSDLSVTYDTDTRTLSVESGDRNVINGYSDITVKYTLNGSQPFEKITLNGTELENNVSYQINGTTVVIGNDNLFFDFVNDSWAQNRYESAKYGGGQYNFDISGWNSRLLPLTFSASDEGTLTDTLGNQGAYNCFEHTYVTSKDCLDYNISDAEIVQIRFKLNNCRFRSDSFVGASFADRYLSSEYNWKSTQNVSVSGNSSDGYITVDIPLTQEIRSLDKIITLKVYINGLEAVSSLQNSSVSYDYIYVGKTMNAPSGLTHKVSFLDKNGTLIAEKTASYGKFYGELPIIQKDRAIFKGWFTSAEGGTQITENSICFNETDEVLYAHWKFEPIELTYDNMFSFVEWSKAERSSVRYYYPNWIPSGKIPIDLYNGSFTINKEAAEYDSARIDYGEDGRYYKIPVKPAQKYIFTVDVTCNDAVPTTFARVYCHNYQDLTPLSNSSKDSYSSGRIVFEVTSASNANYLEFSFEVRTQGATGSWTFSNISLREDSAPYNEINGYEDACRFTTETYTPGNLIKPSRSGYAFDGWYIKGTDTKVNSETVFLDNCQLESRWLPDGYYELTYDNMFSLYEWVKKDGKIVYYYPGWVSVPEQMTFDETNNSICFTKAEASYTNVRTDAEPNTKHFQMPAKQNTEYIITADVFENTPGTGTYASVSCRAFNNQNISALNSSTGSLERNGTISFTLTTAPGTEYIELMFLVVGEGKTGSWTFSNICVRENNAQYRETSGYKAYELIAKKDSVITSLLTPTRTGYHFDGWYICGTDTRLDSGTRISSNLSLYSKWTPCSIEMTNGSCIDISTGFIYGFEQGLDSLDGYISLSDPQCTCQYVNSKDKIGTGTQLNIYKDGTVREVYTVILFGDVNGDGFIDAMDATIVTCLVKGKLSESDLTEAELLAADCNHDGTVNEWDITLMQKAGVFRNQIEQVF